MWGNWDLTIDFVENNDAADDFEVPGDDEDDKPDGEVPVDAPVDEGGGDEAGHEEGFVGDGVEDGASEGLLVPVAGDPAIDAIENGGESVNGDGEPAE